LAAALRFGTSVGATFDLVTGEADARFLPTGASIGAMASALRPMAAIPG
jgi:hypothetical protein